jgi:predicted phage tail protein
MGIEYQAKVIRTKYDTLRERYIEIEIGSDVRSTFGQTLKKDIASNSEAAIATVETNVSQLRAALEEATGKITGATDGYIKQIFNSTGDIITSSVGTVTALILAYVGMPLIVVALAAAGSAYLAGFIITLF